jgi:hypothetical protein
MCSKGRPFRYLLPYQMLARSHGLYRGRLGIFWAILQGRHIRSGIEAGDNGNQEQGTQHSRKRFDIRM